MTDPCPLVSVGFNAIQAANMTDAQGWTPLLDNFTYSSATVLTPSFFDPTTYLQKGDKIRYSQDDGANYKYGYITAVAADSVTVNGGSDYTIANSAVSHVSISRVENPFGFPDWFSCTFTPTSYPVGMTFNSLSIRTAEFTLKSLACKFVFDFTFTAATTNKPSVIVPAPLSMTRSNYYPPFVTTVTLGATLLPSNSYTENSSHITVSIPGTVFTVGSTYNITGNGDYRMA